MGALDGLILKYFGIFRRELCIISTILYSESCITAQLMLIPFADEI